MGLTGLEGDDFPQNAQQLFGHLLGGGESALRIGVGGPHQEPVEGLVPAEDLDVRRVGQAVGVDGGVALEVEGEDGQGTGHGVEVGGDGGAFLGDFGRLVADGAVDGALVVVHAADRAHVDEFELVVLLDGVVHLEVAVDQVAAVQMAEGFEGLDAVRAGLFDRQRVASAVRGAAGVGDFLQRAAADVLHHYVAVEAAGTRVEVLDEVVDADDVGVFDLGEEAAFGDGGGHGVLVSGVQQAFEDDPAVGDGTVHGEVDPAESAVGETAGDLVLAVDDIAGVQLGHERVGVPARGAETFRAAGPAAPGPADGGAAAAVSAEPFSFGYLGVRQHDGGRVGPRHGRDPDQPGAQPGPRGAAAGAGPGAADGDRTAGGAA
ncbi:hypothetical protein STAL104432_28310 [Streptomyces albus]